MKADTVFCLAFFSALVAFVAGVYLQAHRESNIREGLRDRIEILTANHQNDAVDLEACNDVWNECRDRVISDTVDLRNCSRDLVACQAVLRQGWVCGPPLQSRHAK